MFQLQMISNQGYDGIDYRTICVSSSKEKLENIISVIIFEFSEKEKQFDLLATKIETKYKLLRENPYKRTNEEIVEFSNSTYELFNSFETLKLFNIEQCDYNYKTDTFEIKEIIEI